MQTHVEGLRTLLLFFLSDRTRLELDHDGHSDTGLILPQVWAEARARNAGQTRCRRQQRTRHECCAWHQGSGSRIGNCAGRTVDTRCYPTAT